MAQFIVEHCAPLVRVNKGTERHKVLRMKESLSWTSMKNMQQKYLGIWEATVHAIPLFIFTVKGREVPGSWGEQQVSLAPLRTEGNRTQKSWDCPP